MRRPCLNPHRLRRRGASSRPNSLQGHRRRVVGLRVRRLPRRTRTERRLLRGHRCFLSSLRTQMLAVLSADEGEADDRGHAGDSERQ